MEFVNNFKDYEVLDSGDFEKIERFGKYILRRPDPQAIWHPKDFSKYKVNAIYHRSNKGGGEWEFIDLPKTWKISYCLDDNKKMVFNLKPFTFKHTGVFPEQAINWNFVYDFCKNKKDVNILNMFAYTGGATIAAALSGAKVTHVDSAKGMVSWAKENAADSGVANDRIRYLVDDCKKFVRREIRRGSLYDGIIMDPPSYGRGPDNELFKFEEKINPLIENCLELLSDKPLFLIINTYTTGYSPVTMYNTLKRHLQDKGFNGKIEVDEIGIKISNSDYILPCGQTSRFY